eukprot:GHRR01002554.1.p1 GENE.GHRR01002554.1~~GHRR01002554.1.p1  ORF type:complete len:102 (+),score=18.80 GHRR01002554.1:675-980(+)
MWLQPWHGLVSACSAGVLVLLADSSKTPMIFCLLGCSGLVWYILRTGMSLVCSAWAHCCLCVVLGWSPAHSAGHCLPFHGLFAGLLGLHNSMQRNKLKGSK